MQFYVYAIYSSLTDKIYIGQTKDLVKRLYDHKHGYSPYTSRAKDWELFYKEICTSRGSALKREKQLKSYRGREYLRSLLDGNDK
jgi:putative endonuclease